MGKRAVFPGRGSVVTRKLVDGPVVREEGEDADSYKRRAALCAALEGVEVDVILLGRDEGVALSYRLQVILAADERRKAEAMSAGAPVPSAYALETARELREYHRIVIAGGDLEGTRIPAGVREVRGLDVGGVSSEGVSGAELARLLDEAGLLADVSRIVRAAQSPTPRQVES